MLKRLAAIFFIFVIAGQVSAGVCGCLGDAGKPQHSCCKRQKANRDAIRQKGCCDEDCAMQPSERSPQDRTNVTAKISVKAVAEPPSVRLEKFHPLSEGNAVPLVKTSLHRLKYSRPPELYVRHHSFLI